jgi:hypothetical protein
MIRVTGLDGVAEDAVAGAAESVVRATGEPHFFSLALVGAPPSWRGADH